MSKNNQVGTETRGNDSTPICVFVVPCKATDGQIVEHKIIVLADGSVDASEHYNETWALDGQIIEGLGGGNDTNPCPWWNKEKTPNEVLELTIWDEGQLKSRMHYDYIFSNLSETPKFSYDVLAWKGTQVGEWTEPAYNTVLLNLGIVPPTFWGLEETLSKVKDDTTGEEYFQVESLTSPSFLPLPDLLEYLRLIVPNTAGTIFGSHLAEESKISSVEELANWIEAGVPWDTVAAYKYENLDAGTAGEIKKAVDYRKESYGPYNKIGEPEYWAQTLTRLGMQPDRIAPFIERTHRSGMLYWRQEVYETVLELIPLGQFPYSWIIEAVAAIPDRDTLIDYAYEVNKGPMKSGEWTRAWANIVMPERITNKLKSEGNPAYWTPGWETPTKEELEINYEEMGINEQ